MNIGDRIGDYEIVKVIGAGGMGQVYKVRNTLSERLEAMKVALSNLEGNQEALERFQREIKVQAALDHPNIAKLHTAMRNGNQLLMFMEFVDGDSLSKMLESGPLPVAAAVNYASQALDALGYAHSQGVVHRDIKPANIMVTPNGVVKLMDFGIARAKADRKLTQTGSAVGSLFYMSPEQIRGGDPDPRSDLYSFGITLYELVTGKRPFAGNSDFQIMSAHLQESPAPPVDVAAGIPADLSEIILMAIAKDPESRFQSAQAFRGALSNVNVAAASGAAAPHAVAAKSANELPTRTVAGSSDATVPITTRPQTAKTSAPPAPPKPAAPPPQAAPLPAPVAPPPMRAAPVQMAPPPVHVLPQPSSKRGLYMALGSVATLAVLIAAVVEGPKLFKSGSADAQTQSAQVPGASSPATAPAPAPAAVPATPQSAPAAVAPAATPATQATIPQASRQTLPAPVPPPVVQQRQALPVAQSPTPAARPVAAQPPQQSAPQSPPQQAIPQPAAQPPATPIQQPAVQARPATPSPELNELRERYNLVSIRASTAKAGLGSMEQQMARQGLGLRGDIREAHTRMDYMLQESMSSIRAGDVEGGKRNLQMAERALEMIEKFLGR